MNEFLILVHSRSKFTPNSFIYKLFPGVSQTMDHSPLVNTSDSLSSLFTETQYIFFALKSLKSLIWPNVAEVVLWTEISTMLDVESYARH